MAEGVIEQLKIVIGVDSKGVESGVQSAVKKASFSLKSALTTFVAPIMGALMSGQFIKQTYEEIMQIDHLSTALGVSAERLQMWQGAAKDAGSSGEALSAVWQRMNAMITQSAVNGSGTLHDLAEKGVIPALKTIDGKVKDTDTYLLELSDTLSKMDSQAAGGIGRQLGIRDNNLLAFFMQGSGEINTQLRHIKELGVYTKEDVLIAREFDVALNDVTRVLKMSLVPIFRLLTPILSAFGRGIVYISKHMMAFAPIIALIAGLLLKSLIPSIMDLFGKLKLLMMNPLALKIMAIAAVLALIGLALEDIYVWINGGESVIGEYLGSWEEFSSKAKASVERFLTRATELWEQFKEAIQPVIDLVLWFIDVIYLLIQALNVNEEVSSKAWAKMKQAASDFFKPVTTWVDSLKQKLLDFWNFLSGLPGRISGLNFGAINLSARGSGVSDNSVRNVENNITYNIDGAKDPTVVANEIASTNPVSANDTAYD